MKNRFKAVALAGDLKQAFLQIQSPFLSGGTLEQHLERYEEEHPSLKPLIEEVRRSLYVNDLISGGNTQEEARNLKESATSVFQAGFQEAKFKLHKWHSNVPELETVGNVLDEQQESYAKEQLGVKAGETKMLGMVWNQTDDTLGVAFPEPCEQVTKRGC